MKLNSGNILKVLAFPLLLLAIYISMVLVWEVLGLPPQAELLAQLTGFIKDYGLIIIFISAIVEGLLLVGNYFPGGSVIFLGVIASHGDIPQAVLVVSVVCLSFFISYTTNYYLGRYGWYMLFAKFGMKSSLEAMKEKLSKHVFTAIISSYWMPNLAAVCSTAAGILRIPARKFIVESTIALVAWNIFWGTVVYISGEAILKMNTLFALIIFCVWCGLILLKVFVLDKRQTLMSEEMLNDSGTE